VLIIEWLVFSAVFSVLALPEFRKHFSQERHYFVHLLPPVKLGGSKRDAQAREIWEEVVRRGIHKDFLAKLEKEALVAASSQSMSCPLPSAGRTHLRSLHAGDYPLSY